MRRYLTIVFCLLTVWAAPLCMAQNGTSSPFSRYGYGEMNDNIPGAYRAMGGVHIGMRSSKVINAAQPASYTVVDSTTFMFDLAASASWDQYTDGVGTKNKGNGNLDYITMQFPIWKRHIGMSLGVLPYSQVGYSFTLGDSLSMGQQGNYHYQKTYAGKGGISEIYGGLSFNVLDWFAVGANLYYLFGNVENTRSLAFAEGLNPVSETAKIHLSTLRYRLGAQLFHSFDHHAFTVGAIYELKTPMRGTYLLHETVSADTISRSSLASDFPMLWGVGASYTWNKRLQLAFDYETTCWSGARYLTDKQDFRLQDRWKCAAGLEYRHNPGGRKYIDYMAWRLGGSMASSYVSSIYGGSSAPEYTVSVGVGFPLHNIGTIVNTSLEYGHRGSKALLSEDYLQFTINASISETWFFKRKL